ncbi:MAG: mechanosensitive ion channel protein MscS [Flavobacteriaceae bacterium]|nr:mechanosensitive ion channel protein MscS [Flavobacteriaceae bacterium]|tara:strand:+ start:30858 stop:32069 length:1212 start_codon:yes stop_codon:yes gene_type:complete
MYSLFYKTLTKYGVSAIPSTFLSFIIIGVLAMFIYWISARLIKKLFNNLAIKTKSDFDDSLIRNKIPSFLGYLPPIFLLIIEFPYALSNFPKSLAILLNILESITAFLIILIIRGVLRSITDQLRQYKILKDKPLDSYLQVIMIFIWFIGIIIILSLLTGKEIGVFLTTLGALSAVILLIFKDTILGFVASIQITINDTVRIGDWITMTNSGADGDVISISLSSVKIQNFDKTITTIPTYKLISDSFTNWRGMNESDGRRIKRAILIKAKSIKFLTEQEISPLRDIQILSSYINKREKEINEFNQINESNKSELINGRNFTNLGLFRQYVNNYLTQHSKINKNMTIMCRQLAPTPTGIPLEIYAFISDKEWVIYERIVSDLFDHFFAALKSFNLESFEYSSKH